METAARPFDRIVGSNDAANLDLLAEDIGYGVAVFLLGETAQARHVGMISRRRSYDGRTSPDRQSQRQRSVNQLLQGRPHSFILQTSLSRPKPGVRADVNSADRCRIECYAGRVGLLHGLLFRYYSDSKMLGRPAGAG